MELKLYNTLTRKKEPFRPLDPARVRMYVCGPTVYDLAHIGNARPLIVFDVLFRLLRHVYGAEHVTYVRNITDVDDKINARAAERGVSIRDVTEETYRAFQEDVTALGCLPPTHEPRATEYVRRDDGKLDMITLIERLIANGNAYAADGHVLFNVPSMPDYGRLSQRPLDEMIAGARVEVAPYKRDPQDFVLWKPSNASEPGWESPWGFGRPGWHIECSAMSAALLGETFDIHGGGIDLVFPHHENEIAQSRCAFQTDVMANVWMHNGYLQVEGEKMSKSLGNFVTIRELLRGWKGQPWTGSVTRWAMLQTHYRQPIDWTYNGLLAAKNELSQFFDAFKYFDYKFENDGQSLLQIVEGEFQPSKDVVSALLDDLNTPEVIAILRDQKPRTIRNRDTTFQALRNMMFLGVVTESTRYIFSSGLRGRNWPRKLTQQIGGLGFNLRVARANGDQDFFKVLLDRANFLQIVVEDRGPNFFELAYEGPEESSVQTMIDARNTAREEKRFAESDRIRDELVAMGVVLKDFKDPATGELTTEWEFKR